jgi:hypothetical protein
MSARVASHAFGTGNLGNAGNRRRIPRLSAVTHTSTLWVTWVTGGTWVIGGEETVTRGYPCPDAMGNRQTPRISKAVTHVTRGYPYKQQGCEL